MLHRTCYGGINRKLGVELSKGEIEGLIMEVIEGSDGIERIGMLGIISEEFA